MIGIVVVSHSEGLARGVVEVARQMAADVPIAAAGGTDDGRVGTSLEKVLAGLEEADSGEGAVVLYDLGSAQMTAEMALEAVADPDRIRVVDAPLVEGALAAATAAAAGATLDAVAEAAGAGGAGTQAAPPTVAADGLEETVTLVNPLGLHARPAAAVVAAVADLDAEVTVETGAGTASARSLLGLVGLAAGGGTELTVRASGPDASEAVGRVVGLAEAGFGESDEPPPAVPEREPERPPGTARAARGLLRGVTAAPGVALGPAARIRHAPVAVPDHPADDAETERRRLGRARRQAAEELAGLASGPEGDIFAAHRLLLDDPELDEAVEERLARGDNAARAWHEAVGEMRQRLAALPGTAFAARAADVADVGGRVLRGLLGVEEHGTVEPGSVVVAEDLVPSQLPALAGTVAGVALAGGAPTAHAAIIARNLGLPMVVALGSEVTAIPDGAVLLLDGAAGTVAVDPSTEVRDAARARQRADEEERAVLSAAAREPGRLADGTRISIAANVASVPEASLAVAQGAEGVGLLRTEFLFLDRPSVPSEDEQVEALTALCAAMEGRPVIVRTLDVGGDKNLPALELDPVRHGFLGERGLRYSLRHPELLETQLRAILRTAADHPVSVMFPMVTTADEVREARAAIDRARASLPAPGEFREVGIMVEVPAAALAAAPLAAEADFFSIGSNDLVQYTMAAERTNPAVADLYQPAHPALLRLVAALCDAADHAGRWVGVCGEAAADPELAVTLVGLGVRELSMAPAAIPAVKARLRETTLEDARAAATTGLAR